MTKPKNIVPPALSSSDSPEQGEILLYAAEGGKNVIQVRMHGESLWLSQK